MNTKPYRPYCGRRRRRTWPILLLCLVLAAALTFSVLEGVVLFHARDDVQGEPEVVVILGAQLQPQGPSLFLQRRLERALAYLDDHPDALVVVSGGQGPDEPDTEANGMETFLRSHGFSGTVLQEDRSHNTRENLVNTKSVLAGAGYDVGDGVLLVTSDFHLARAKLLAAHYGYRVSALAAPSDHLFYKIFNYLREPLALIKARLMDW